MIFCITFPSDHIFANNWIEIEATDQVEVQKWAMKNFPLFASIYPEEDFHREFFRDGKIGRMAEI